MRVNPLDHQKLVCTIAREYRGRGVDMEDLVSEGQFGLLTACERFDPSKGFRFSTYATPWIRQAIRRAIQLQRNAIYLPVHIQADLAKGKTPETPGLSPSRRDCLFDALYVQSRWRHRVWRVEEMSSIDADDRAGTRHRVAAMLRKLPARDANILRYRFGIDREPLSLSELSIRFQVSTRRISQIEKTAIKQLKKFATKEQVA